MCSVTSKVTLLLETNLRLIDEKLGELQATPYFHRDLEPFVDQLRDLTQITLSRLITDQPEAADFIARNTWKATQFIAGSNTNLIPYEVVHCLRQALDEWTDSRYLITTDITADRNFYFHGVPEQFWQMAKTYADIEFDNKLVQIQLPELYRHRPLFNLVLYHELGHFIESTRQLSKLALLYLESDGHKLPSLSSKPSGWSDVEFDIAEELHTREYFADAFATCYLGTSMRDFLLEFAPDEPIQVGHPRTYDREQVMTALLEDQPNNLIEMFDLALAQYQLPKLGPRYDVPNIAHAFDALRPHTIGSTPQLHGMFEAGWNYLKRANERNSAPWNEIPAGEVERIVNDLTEKSIRNFMLKERWDRAKKT